MYFLWYNCLATYHREEGKTMTKKEATRIEKQKAKKLIEYFEENRLRKEKESVFEQIIARFFKLELESMEMGIKFDPENYESKKDNDIILKFIETNPKDLGYFSVFDFDDKYVPQIEINKKFYNSICNYTYLIIIQEITYYCIK